VTALVAPSESLSERVDRLVRSHSDAWPPLHTATTAGAIAEIIAHIDGLEEAIHAMAQEIQRLAAERDRLEAHAMDD
jgi:hypothetical protein